jgi:hypothetical protein
VEPTLLADSAFEVLSFQHRIKRAPSPSGRVS